MSDPTTRLAYAVLATLILLPLLTLAIYRLYFHPLSSIPGPKLAALTYLYENYYDCYLPGQFVFHIKELHKTYGPIIRVNPREVHIADVDFAEQIYPTSNLRKREKDYFALRNLGLYHATAGARDHELHRRRREALSPFFSQASVLALEGLIKDKVSRLCAHFDRAIDGGVVNVYDLFSALARDVVFEYSFDKESNVLGDAEYAGTLRRNLTKMLLQVKINANFPWLVQGMNRAPAWLRQRWAPAGAKNMLELRQSIGDEVGVIMRDREEQTHKRSILWDIRAHKNLQNVQDLPARLGQEGTFLVMAGTESTAKSMAIATFHMLANSEMMGKVRAELQTLPADASIKQLQQLPYLSAVMVEAHRLSFGLTGRNLRVAPEETLTYGKHVIPPGTPVSMTTLCIHTDESVYPDAWSFQPERWLGDEAEAKRKLRFHYGFGRGARRCPGENLANAEMVATLAAVARYDLELYETTLDDVEFKHDYQVAHPKLDSQGVRVLVKGRYK